LSQERLPIFGYKQNKINQTKGVGKKHLLPKIRRKEAAEIARLHPKAKKEEYGDYSRGGIHKTPMGTLQSDGARGMPKG